MSSTITFASVNNLSDEQFVSIFGNVVEHFPEAAINIKNKRPFNNVTQLCEAFHTYLDQLSIEEKVKVLKQHPDLAGKMAARGELTPESAAEQRAAGLEELIPQQRDAMNQNNQLYKNKFGFPFIICAKENKIQSILEGLQIRYNNSYQEEIITGVNEVKKICRLRIFDILKD